jgi:hypothetical protein
MFGLDRTFLCQSSALEMLCREGMDFNHLLRRGIRYLSKDEETEIRAKEMDRVDGVREEIIVDEGGEKFLESVKYFPFQVGIDVGLKSRNGWQIHRRTNTISATSQSLPRITNEFFIRAFRLCFPI